jgi:hypothetical protein
MHLKSHLGEFLFLIWFYCTCLQMKETPLHLSAVTVIYYLIFGSFDSKLADAGNSLIRQLGRHLCRPRADWRHLGNRSDLTSSRPAEAVPQKTAKSAQRAVLWLLGCPEWGFPCFSSVVRRIAGHNEKKGHGPPPHHRGLQPKWSPPKSQRPSAKTTPTLLGSTPRKTIQPESLYEG